MAFVFLRVARLLEGAQHEERKDALLGLARNALREPLVVKGRDFDFLRVHLFVETRMPFVLVLPSHAQPSRGGQLDAQRIAERGGDFLKLQNLFRVGLFVNAVKRRNAAVLEVARHTFVGGQHELFDDAVRDVALRARDADHAAVLVEFDFRLWQIEINRAARVALPVQQPRQLFHQLEILNQRPVALDRRGFPRQDVAHRGVRHTLGAVNQAGNKLVLEHAALGVNCHKRRHHQPVHVRIQAADAV